MKRNQLIKAFAGIVFPVLFMVISQGTFAQNVPVTQQMPDTAKMTYNQISQSCKLYVFPRSEERRGG